MSAELSRRAYAVAGAVATALVGSMVQHFTGSESTILAFIFGSAVVGFVIVVVRSDTVPCIDGIVSGVERSSHHGTTGASFHAGPGQPE